MLHPSAPVCLALLFAIGFSSVSYAAQACCDLKANHKPESHFRFTIPTPDNLGSCKWVNYWPSAVSFVGPNRLIVAGHYDCFDPPSFPLEVHVSHSLSYILLLDVTTGETIKTAQWKDESVSPYRGDTIQVLSSPAGILFEAGQYIKLLDADLNVVKTRSLPVSNKLEQWKAFLSPDGTKGLLRHWGTHWFNDDSSFGEDHWFSPETLEDTLVESGVPYSSMFIAIDEDAVYYHPSLERTAAEKSALDDPIYVRHQGEKAGKQLCAECRGLAEKVFRNRDVLISQRGPRAAFSVFRPTGELIFQGRYGDPPDDIRTVVEGNGRALLNFGHFGGLSMLSSVEAAAVVSIPDNKMIFDLRAKPSLRKDREGGVDYFFPLCTISPDGTTLAALEGTALYIFRLPQ